MKKFTRRMFAFLMIAVLGVVTWGVSPAFVKAAAVTPETGNIYYIKNKNSGLYLTVEGDSASNGANVVQATGTGSVGQRWILEKNSNGTYRIHPATDMTGGVSLDVANGSTANSANIQIWENNSLSPQNFGITASGDGYVITTEVTSHSKCLDVSGASKNSGANVLQYTSKSSANQIWYFEEAPWPSSGSSSSSSSSTSSSSSSSSTTSTGAAYIEEGWYYIKNINSNKYLQVTDNNGYAGANVEQGTGTGVQGQRWYADNVGNGYYVLKSGLGNYNLDVYGWGTSDGTNIGIWDANGLDCQQFMFKEVSSGVYAILTKLTGEEKGLDVYNISTADGANVCQWSYWGGTGQQWRLEAIDTSGSSSGSSSSSSSSSSGSVSSAIDADGYPDQLMTFVSTSDGAYVTASNSSIVSSSTSSTSNRWKIVKSGSDYYKIINAATGQVLAPASNSATSGASVVTTSSPSGSSQYWKIVSVKTDCNGTALNYKVVNYANTSLALTLSGSSYVLSSYSGSATQCFRFNSYGAEGFAGYAKNMSSQEKASVTGGVLGDVVYVTSVSQLQSYASGSTAYTIVISSDISASSLTKVTVGQNKTFIGKFGSAELYNIHFRCISSSGNVIFKNITFSHDAAQNENDDIQMYISNGVNFWIDHCTFTGHTSMQSDDVDKHMYVGLTADYVSVTGCYFGGHKYGLILGYPGDDGSGTYTGYPHMTICNNYFYNVYTRAPGLMRYGYFHCYNNYVYGFNLGYTPYTDCNIYSEKNYFDAGSYSGKVVDDKGVGAFTDSGSVLTSSVSSLATAACSWRPSSNYGYATRSASDAMTWAKNYAGAQNSKIVYAID